MAMTVDLITINTEKRTFLLDGDAQTELMTQRFLNPPSLFDNVLILSKQSTTELIAGHSIVSIALRSEQPAQKLFPHIRPEVSLLTDGNTVSAAVAGDPETLALHFRGGQCIRLKLLENQHQLMDVDFHQRITNVFTSNWIFYLIDDFSMGLANVRNLDRVQLNFSPKHLPKGTLYVIKES